MGPSKSISTKCNLGLAANKPRHLFSSTLAGTTAAFDSSSVALPFRFFRGFSKTGDISGEDDDDDEDEDEEDEDEEDDEEDEDDEEVAVEVEVEVGVGGAEALSSRLAYKGT